MKSLFGGLCAKTALAFVAVGLTMTSCYDSENVEIVGPSQTPAEYVIYGNVTSASTGEALDGMDVTLSGTASGSDKTESGAFLFDKNNVSGITSGLYTISINADGYLPATRTIYLQHVNNGESAVAVADIVLYDASTQAVEPENQAPATQDQAEAAKAEVQKQVTELLGKVEGINADDVTVEVDANGNTVVTAPAELTGDFVENEDVAVQVPSFTGFASTITPESDLTRALTPAQIWVASAAQALNRAYGLTQVSVSRTLPGRSGAAIVGYKLEITMTNEVLQFDGIEGTVTYQRDLVVTPTYDSHDSHDQHGNGNGSGGGAGE